MIHAFICGKVLDLDINHKNYEIGLPVIEKAGVAHKIHFREAHALLMLDQIIANAQITVKDLLDAYMNNDVPVLDKPYSGNNQTWNQSLAMVQAPYRPPPVHGHNHHQWSFYPPTENPYHLLFPLTIIINEALIPRLPIRLEIKGKLAQRSERVKSVDLHPTEPWILTSSYSGTVCIWDYQSQVFRSPAMVDALNKVDYIGDFLALVSD
ncbi:coatomer subunit beta'-2-like protein [Tanacetum coccineum]